MTYNKDEVLLVSKLNLGNTKYDGNLSEANLIHTSIIFDKNQ